MIAFPDYWAKPGSGAASKGGSGRGLGPTPAAPPATSTHEAGSGRIALGPARLSDDEQWELDHPVLGPLVAFALSLGVAGTMYLAVYLLIILLDAAGP